MVMVQAGPLLEISGIGLFGVGGALGRVNCLGLKGNVRQGLIGEVRGSMLWQRIGSSLGCYLDQTQWGLAYHRPESAAREYRPFQLANIHCSSKCVLCCAYLFF